MSIVKALWYSVLVMSLVSVAAASQQLVAIQRLRSHRDGPRITRQLLSGDLEVDNSVQAPAQVSSWQGFIWQIPVMLLNGSLYLFVTGLLTLVYYEATGQLNWAKDAGSLLVRRFTIMKSSNWERSVLCECHCPY